MDMPKIIYVRDDGDGGIEFTDREDMTATGYVRVDVFPESVQPTEMDDKE